MIDLYGADWCSDCRRSKNLLTRLGVDFQYLDVAVDDAARDRAIELAGSHAVPVVRLPDGRILIEPSDPELRRAVERAGLLVSDD